MTLLMDETVSTETVLTWKTDNVAEWLTSIGLEKYTSKFKRNMITGAILVQLDEILLDDLNITNVNDRDVLLQSVAGFAGPVEDYIKAGSLTQSSLITSFADEEDCQNTRCEPEMEVLKSNEDDCEEKTTKFPAFAELLPTIGEEEEMNEGEEKINPVTLTMILSGESNDNVIQVVKPEENGKDTFDTKKDDRHTKGNVNLCENASTSLGDVSNRLSLEDDEVASRATQIVQVFSEENMRLRKQLEKYYQEIKHLKMVDKELRDTQIMYKDLKSAFITREHKEKAMRSRMEAEISQLQNTNTELTDQLKEHQATLASRPEKELKELANELDQKNDEVKELQKERKISRSSLQNLERMLKQKSSEIMILRQQLETSVCNICRSKQKGEEQDNRSNEKKTSAGDYLEQFRESMIRSSHGRYGTRFQNGSNQRFRNKKDDLDINACVPVLVELLKEKDAEIVKLRKEIDEEMPRLSDNMWSSNTFGERLPKHRPSNKRYSDLETEIRTLHVKLAEKDAQIKILQCKYGESSLDSKPFRIPSFTSQSSVSSYQDSGIMTAPDSHFDDVSYRDTKGDENPERYSPRLQESDYDQEIDRDGRQLNRQEDATVLSDHCWFV